MLRLLPFLLLLACASSPDTYQRGAYRPVSPNPTFNPSQDAPHRTGQPGHVRPRPVVPLSPHTRVLPQTPETRQHPGLWSGDQPRAARAPPWRGWPTTVLGVDLFVHDLPAPWQEKVQECAYLISRVTEEDVMKRALQRLSVTEIQCLVARLNAYCAMDAKTHLDKVERQKRTLPKNAKEAVNAINATAVRLDSELCRDVNVSPLTPLLDYNTQRWPTIMSEFYAPN